MFLFMTNSYDFDTCPDRTGFGSLKWDKYKGRDILPLWVADMDFRSAPEIVDALQARLDHGVFGYTIPHEGPTRAVLEYLNRAHGYTAKAGWLNFLPGLVPAINLCCRAFTQPGESILTATPVYPPFLSAPEYAGRDLIDVPLCLGKDDQWTLDFEAMEAAVRPDTRMLILCNPHNPVGRVFTERELRELGNFCQRHDLVLISDEIHCDLVFDPSARHRVTATLDPSIAKRTVTLMAPSKTYNLPGLACAFSIIEDANLRQQFQKTIRGIITEVNCFGYAGCEAAYRHGEPWRQALLDYLRSNYELVLDFVKNRLPGIHMRPMQATYLAWLDVSELGLEDPAGFFEKHGLGLSDGQPFAGPQHIRLNFGCPRERLQIGLERMEKALQQL
jgi:cystathionine beta-lyase